jgi:hypothetical protein
MKRAYAVVNFTTSSGVRFSEGQPPMVPRMPDIDFMSVIISKNVKKRSKSFAISDKNINFTRILKIK